jgi:integrase/recombinase XerD
MSATATRRTSINTAHLAVQTGLRASELTTLRRRDIHLGAGPHVSCMGKGRKRRVTPLTAETVGLLHTWMAERCGGADDVLFPTNRGTALSHDALAQRLAVYAARCPRLTGRTVTPHVLRHYVDGRVMWPVEMTALAGTPRWPVPAT